MNTDNMQSQRAKLSSPLQQGGDIRVLIAEDSPTIRHHLISMIDETPGIRVVGQAQDGEEALALAASIRPDVISMDIRMPRMDGMEATRRIMATCPTPVVVVSGLVQRDVELSFEAIQAGALAVVEKPPARSHPGFAAKQRELARTLAAMAKVSVVRRGNTRPLGDRVSDTLDVMLAHMPEVIAIGASAGGPSALSKVLKALPANLPVPVLVVQHISQEFIPGLARWLDKETALSVQVAQDNMVLQPGVVNLSPGIAHIGVQRYGRRLVVRLVEEQGPYRYQPSVDYLFASVAQVCGPRAIGMILTGMGDDGASGLLAMRQHGARTLAQDRASATVYGMPGAAVEKGAVEQVISLADLPAAILKIIPGIG